MAPYYQTIVKHNYISNLPDELLCHILSYLPTNYVVATSVLSKRWKFLWKYVSSVHIDLDLINQNDDDVVNSCMYKVMRELEVEHIRNISVKGRLSYTKLFNGYDDEDGIIHEAIRLNVERLELLLPCSYSCPTVLFTGATSLVQLKLSNGTWLEGLPRDVYFPKLKILHLDLFDCLKDEIAQKLVAGCPILEKLHIESLFHSTLSCRISSSSLTHLTLLLVVENLEINVPNLRYLDIMVEECKNLYVISTLSYLIEAHIDIHDYSVPRRVFGREIIPRYLQHIYNVKTLGVPSSMLNALSFAPLDTFTIFQNITHLKIKAETCNWNLLSYILERSINLQVLTFTKDFRGTCNRERSWYEPRNVPKCVVSSLRLVSIIGYQGLNDETKMVKYLLDNANVLNRLEIGMAFGATTWMRRKIQRLHKAAKTTCEIVFLS